MKNPLSASRLSQLQDPVLILESKNSIALPPKKGKGERIIKPLTLATSSTSLLAGASTVKGVIVAEATALAAYKTKGHMKFRLNYNIESIKCLSITQLVRPA